MKKLVLGLVILAAVAGIAMAILHPPVVIGTAQNVVGTVWVRRVNEVNDRQVTSGMQLCDDDQLKLTPGSNLEAVSAYGAPMIKISYGDNGYWNAQTGTKNPPNSDWIYCRGSSYASFY
jgi:hypothetical protein